VGCLETCLPVSSGVMKGLGNRMKSRLRGVARAAAVGLAAVCVVGVETGQAADLAVKVPVKAATPVHYSWTGCYAGAFVGWAAANDWQATDLNGFSAGGANPWDFSLGNQATGGGTLGCNWQATSLLVLGVEGEGGYLNVSGATPQPVTGTVLDSGKIGSGYGLIAGRAGLAFDRLLIYGKVGVAFYDTSATVTTTAPALTATGSQSQSTLALGVGGEYAIYDHWSGKAEYVFFDKGSAFNACSEGFCWRQQPSTVQTFKIGLNYKFW
jgi:outer membrane immunogenic protein